MSRKRKKRGKGKDKNRKGFSLKRETVLSILQIGVFLGAVLIVISFSRKGAFLIQVNDLLLSYFSWSAVFVPFILISFGFLISKFKTPLSSVNVFVGSLLFSVS